MAINTLHETKDGYVIVSNKTAGIRTKTYGDFKFAKTKKEFRELNEEQKPLFRNILFYAKTFEPAYDYYLLINSKHKPKQNGTYSVKDTTISGNNFILLISQNAPVQDMEFISTNIYGE